MIYMKMYICLTFSLQLFFTTVRKCLAYDNHVNLIMIVGTLLLSLFGYNYNFASDTICDKRSFGIRVDLTKWAYEYSPKNCYGTSTLYLPFIGDWRRPAYTGKRLAISMAPCISNIELTEVKVEMARQISTSVSDFILACSAFYVAVSLYLDNNIYAASGLLIQGAAASVGVVRFSMRRPELSTVFRAHKLLSWLAATAGMGFIAYQFCSKYQALLMSYVIISFSGLVTLFSQLMDAKNKQLFVQASSGLALLTVLILSVLHINVYGASAALVYILSGAVFGSDGVLFGIQRVDLLHYGLVAGNLLFLYSLT